MNRVHLANAAAIIIAAAGFALLDTSLALGELQGLVYTLYLLVFAALQLLLNAALATYHHLHGNDATHYLISALLYPVIATILAYALPALT